MFYTPTTFYGAGEYGEGAYNDGPSQGLETTAVDRTLIPLPPPIFTGMKLQSDVILGNLVFNRIDENNVIWVCTDIEGWWVHPDPDIPDVTRGWRDGSYDARGRWQARQITLTGSILSPDPSLSPAARNTLIEATSLVYEGAWLKTVENPTRASYVRLSGRPNIASTTARGRIDFSIGLRAADPIKYSWNDADPDGYDLVTIPCENTATSEDGEESITNLGNISVPVFLEVTGPTVGDTTVINETTGEVLTITGDLRTSEVLTVTDKELTSNEAILTVSSVGNLIDGDVVTVAGVDSTFNGLHVLTDVDSGTSKIRYALTATNVVSQASSGTVSRDADYLEIDTYEREVGLNGSTFGARTYVDTLTDWITLQPGANTIKFIDEGTADGTSLLKVYYRSGWIG
jgi:hypothetical protein